MSKFIITKTIDLDFLGDKYKGSSIEVRVISMRERDEVLAGLKKVNGDETKSGNYVRDTILDRFVSGIFKDGEADPVELEEDDLLNFPPAAFIEIMSQLQGRTSPKS